MRAGFVLLPALLLAVACVATNSASPHVYSPSELMSARLELEGRDIRVRGWLGGCKLEDNRICGLYSNQRNALGPEPMEWALPIEFDEGAINTDVREVIAGGRYVVTCRRSETTICPDVAGYFVVDSIED